jgi:hypothetical protein
MVADAPPFLCTEGRLLLRNAAAVVITLVKEVIATSDCHDRRSGAATSLEDFMVDGMREM